MELLSRRRWNLYRAQVVSCCVYDKPKKVMQHMHGIIPFMLDCWADPVVYLLILESSMDWPTDWRSDLHIDAKNVLKLFPCSCVRNTTGWSIAVNKTFIVTVNVITILFKQLWQDVASHVTSLKQQSFISEWDNYSNLKIRRTQIQWIYPGVDLKMVKILVCVLHPIISLSFLTWNLRHITCTWSV